MVITLIKTIIPILITYLLIVIFLISFKSQLNNLRLMKNRNRNIRFNYFDRLTKTFSNMQKSISKDEKIAESLKLDLTSLLIYREYKKEKRIQKLNFINRRKVLKNLRKINKLNSNNMYFNSKININMWIKETFGLEIEKSLNEKQKKIIYIYLIIMSFFPIKNTLENTPELKLIHNYIFYFDKNLKLEKGIVLFKKKKNNKKEK